MLEFCYWRFSDIKWVHKVECRSMYMYIHQVHQAQEWKDWFGYTGSACWMDDILWFSNNTEMLKKEKEALAKRFQVEDMGEVMFLVYLWSEIVKQGHLLLTSQSTWKEYWKDLECRSTCFNTIRAREVIWIIIREWYTNWCSRVSDGNRLFNVCIYCYSSRLSCCSWNSFKVYGWTWKGSLAGSKESYMIYQRDT